MSKHEETLKKANLPSLMISGSMESGSAGKQVSVLGHRGTVPTPPIIRYVSYLKSGTRPCLGPTGMLKCLSGCTKQR